MEELPQPRKQPAQSRSRTLVSSVLEASLIILDSASPKALTMDYLAEVSGVSVGSIYQYFSTKEAIIAAVYEKILDQEADSLKDIGEQVKCLSAPDALRLIYANALRVEIRLYRLNENFHRKYFKRLQISDRYSDVKDSNALAEKTWFRFIEFYQKELHPIDKKVAAHILTRGYRGLIGAVLEDHPEIVSSEAFLDSLVAMALCCLNYKQS